VALTSLESTLIYVIKGDLLFKESANIRPLRIRCGLATERWYLTNKRDDERQADEGSDEAMENGGGKVPTVQ